MARMDLRHELHSDQLPPIEQLPPVTDASTHDGDVVLTEKTHQQEYLEELAFMEEPVVIRLEPSTERNAAQAFPIWCNGRGAEILINGAWRECTYLPVGVMLTTKRKYLEIIVRAKITTFQTEVRNSEGERPDNRANPFTSAVHSFSVIEDRNPKGAPWLSELRRRNL